MDAVKQFETMAAIRAYAQKIANADPADVRPSTGLIYKDATSRMAELAATLNTKS